MAFPMGMKRAAQENSALTPWLWGVNGATSVCASVLAVVIAMAWGISAASWIGVGCYALAVVAYGDGMLKRSCSQETRQSSVPAAA
jgi:hypothetical protein